jgi:hypothetical protein
MALRSDAVQAAVNCAPFIGRRIQPYTVKYKGGAYFTQLRVDRTNHLPRNTLQALYHTSDLWSECKASARGTCRDLSHDRKGVRGGYTYSRTCNNVSVKLIAVIYGGRFALVEWRVGKGGKSGKTGKLVTDTQTRVVREG